MELALPALFAGVLTILAPCVIPLLPVIIGGSAAGWQHRLKPLVITASLTVSVAVFTLLIRASTVLIDIPPKTWEILSGGLVVLIGATLVWPKLWEPLGNRLNPLSGRLLQQSSSRSGWFGTILTGAALGPVFVSCSPTYGFILFTILPKAAGEGIVLLLIYLLGLASMLLAAAYLGQRWLARFSALSDPNGPLKRTIGVVFIIVGLAVMTGLAKTFETWLIDIGIYDPIAELEFNLLDRVGE